MGHAGGEGRFKRVLAALDALARDATPVRLERLMGFLRLLMDDVASDPARFAAHIGGNLVVDFRRNYWWSTLVIVADDGRVFSDVSARTLPFVSYESITKFVESESSPLGPAFVLMSDDLVSASVLEEVALDDEAYADPPLSCSTIPPRRPSRRAEIWMPRSSARLRRSSSPTSSRSNADSSASDVTRATRVSRSK